jgi:hypothetical protein
LGGPRTHYVTLDPFDTWSTLYERTAVDVDYEQPFLPAHPDLDQRALIVVEHHLQYRGRFELDLPAPSYSLIAPNGYRCHSVWWLAWPVMNTAETKRQWNSWSPVASCLAHSLRGVLPEMIVNPLVYGEDQLPVHQEEHYLLDLRVRLRRAGLWKPEATMPRGMQARGGSAGTDAQAEARRANIAKGREALAAKRAART